MFSLTKFIREARIALTSEEEMKYAKLASVADNAADASRSAEKMDKLAKKAVKGSATAKIAAAFGKDIDDILA